MSLKDDIVWILGIIAVLLFIIPFAIALGILLLYLRITDKKKYDAFLDFDDMMMYGDDSYR